MCTICSALRPYTPDCDYEGLAQTTGATTAMASTAPVATLDELAAYLADGFWPGVGGVAHGYDTSVSNEITVNISGLSADGQQLARWAFEAWEAVADIVFVEVTTADAQIVIDDNDPGSITGYLAVEDITESSTINIGPDWLAAYGTQLGSYAFQSYMHEIGHALGLGHLGQYNETATYGTDELFANDSWQLSLMSYFDQQQNTMVNDTRAETVTPMMADIVAIQSIYGAAGSGSLTAGDTIYGEGHTLGTSWMGLLIDAALGNGSAAVWDGTPFSLTVYDQGGYDIIDFSKDTNNQIVDLNGEGISDVLGLEGNMAIARGTVIEEYRAGKGNDEITGNAADNVILGGKGEDTIHGGDGADYLQGDRNKDMMFGGAGDDVMIGGKGNDTLKGEDGQDDMQGGYSNDKLVGGGGKDKLHGGDGKDNLQGGGGRDTLTGGKDNDKMKGNGGSDVFSFKTGDGVDVITDFDALDDNEVIHLKKVTAITDFADLMDPAENHIAQVGSHVVITDGAGLEITLQNVALSDLDANDFIF